MRRLACVLCACVLLWCVVALRLALRRAVRALLCCAWRRVLAVLGRRAPTHSCAPPLERSAVITKCCDEPNHGVLTTAHAPTPTHPTRNTAPPFDRSGVITKCCDELNHGVLLVGYGSEEAAGAVAEGADAGGRYYLVKNSARRARGAPFAHAATSPTRVGLLLARRQAPPCCPASPPPHTHTGWGAGWGEGGYFKLRYGTGKGGLCGIATSASYPVRARAEGGGLPSCASRTSPRHPFLPCRPPPPARRACAGQVARQPEGALYV